MSQFSKQQVQHVADLANIPLQENELQPLADAFSETISVIQNLNEVDTKNVEPVHQVTGLENITRNDVIDTERMFTQKEALANASQKHKGMFVVPAVLKHK